VNATIEGVIRSKDGRNIGIKTPPRFFGGTIIEAIGIFAGDRSDLGADDIAEGVFNGSTRGLATSIDAKGNLEEKVIIEGETVKDRI
jgi:hypothetical protein